MPAGGTYLEMRIPRSLVLSFVTLALMAGGVFAQSPIGVVSSFSLGSTTLKSTSYNVQISLTYPGGTTASSFVSAAQLSSDFQGFVAGYPTAGDPPEAILSSVLASILSKYPQMSGASLFASNFGGSSPVTVGPQLPVVQNSSIQVFQGTFLGSGVTGGILGGTLGIQPAVSKAPANR